MTREITLRVCSCIDWVAVSSLAIDCFPSLWREEINSAICLHGENLRALKVGGVVAGFYLYYPTEDGEEAWLDYLAVSRQHRGRGLGARLLQDFERVAARQGFSRLGLAVDLDNASAINLYRSFGFRCIERAERQTFAKTIETKQAPARSRRSKSSKMLQIARYSYRRLLFWFLD